MSACAQAEICFCLCVTDRDALLTALLCTARQVVESHQRTKADTSGTAKAIVASFQKLGVDFNEVRLPEPDGPPRPERMPAQEACPAALQHASRHA